MNLKLHLGGILQGRPSTRRTPVPVPAPDGGDTLPCPDDARRRDALAQQHLLRMRIARDRELNQLRALMAHRRNGPARAAATPAALAASRSPFPLESSRLLNLINGLESEVFSEPMACPGPLPLPPQPPEDAAPSGTGTSGPHPHPLDDAALMVAAQQWGQAADLLLGALDAGQLPGEAEWAPRCAVDLFERDGQPDRARALRRQYRLQGAAQHVVPSPLAGTAAGGVLPCAIAPWRCPEPWGAADVGALLARLAEPDPAGSPVVLDWRAMARIDAAALPALQALVEQAMRSRTVFVHVGLARLVDAARQAMREQAYAKESRDLWLALLNWTGFRQAHAKAAAVFAHRFGDAPPPWRHTRCVGHRLNTASGAPAQDLIRAACLQGELTNAHIGELGRFDAAPPCPGGLVLLDLRHLASMDFFFGAELLNAAIRRHAKGEAVCVAHAHPLLAHYLRMLGMK